MNQAYTLYCLYNQIALARSDSIALYCLCLHKDGRDRLRYLEQSSFLRTSLEISVLGCHVMCYPWYYLYMILFLLLFVYIHNDGRDRNNYVIT